MRVAVLIKQVPSVESMALGPDGRLVREGRDLEINAYCRRAISQGVELARASGGTCSVFTLGPPSAEDALREAVAWGADEGVLISDPAFAGSDTLATARALAGAVQRLGPFDVILAGRNSVDADTGQVGPEVAELLGLPFLGGVKAMNVKSGTVVARLEHDDGWADAEVDLPALLSCAERLCPPAKVGADGRAAVDPGRLRRLNAGDLGPGPWGEAGSPTRVGRVRGIEVSRHRRVLTGALEEQVARAVALLQDAGALGPAGGAPGANGGRVADGWTRGGKGVAVLVEPDRPRLARQLLGSAAHLAQCIDGHAVALVPAGAFDPATASSWGADEVVLLPGPPAQDPATASGWGAGEVVLPPGPPAQDPATASGWGAGEVVLPPGPPAGSTLVWAAGEWAEEDLARAAGDWAAAHQPWAVLAPGTMWGREVAGRMAARLGAGLTGDAVELAVDGGRLVSWKPAFGGQLVAAITSSSAIQMATVRGGVLPTPEPRPARPVRVTTQLVRPAGRVRLLAAGRDDDLDDLATAEAVVGVGAGVDSSDYDLLAPLLEVLGGELAATRKVTDQGWQSRSRQVGLTGRSLAPRLYVAIGLSGKFNHLIGVRSAGMILAVNSDPSAPVFDHADVGVVGDWHLVVPLLAEAIAQAGREDASV